VTKRMLIMLIVVGLVFGLIFAFIIGRSMLIKYFISTAGEPTQTVSTVTAEEKPWQPLIAAVGSLHAVQGSDLSAEVAGIVSKVGFNGGDSVKAGDLLVELRADSDVAKLKSLQANAQLARQTFDRAQKLHAGRTVSKAYLDNAAAALKSADAQVAEQQALVDKKIIRAPFAGKAGTIKVNVGQYVTPGQQLVTLQQLDPIHIDFSLPQQQVSQIVVGGKVVVTSDAYPDKSFEGEVTSFDPKIDTETRNVAVRATLSNPEQLLLPGMFARITLTVGEPENFVTLPQTAIVFNSYGETVFVLEETKDEEGSVKYFAKQKFIKTGERRGDQVAVTQGVEAGEIIVSLGGFKLRNGTPVRINNELDVPNDADPQPVDE